jgi:hypothetical protein
VQSSPEQLVSQVEVAAQVKAQPPPVQVKVQVAPLAQLI